VGRKGLTYHAINGGRNGSQGSQLAWQYHESNLRMRAGAGKVWIVTADNCSPTRIPCSAPSGVIDPKGQWAFRTANQGEQHFVHTIDLS
jgi:predicted amidohydrolase